MLKAFWNFDIFIFPRIALVIYWIGLFVLALGAVGGLFGMLSVVVLGSGSEVFLAGLFGFVGSLAGMVVWRLVVEFWLVIFSIRDMLRDIRDEGRARTLSPPAP